MTNREKRAEIILLVLCCAAPFLAVLLCVHTYGVNVPYWDEWSFIDLIRQLPAKGFSVFWTRHNEHRIFFPQLVMYVSLMLTKWNVKILMYLSQFIVFLVGIAYFLYIRRGFRSSSIRFQLIAFFPISVLIFSFVQVENILWGFQVGFYMTMAASVFCLYFFYLFTQKKRLIFIIIADCFGLIATLSSAQGNMVWISVLFAAAVFFFTTDKKSSNFKIGLLSTIPAAIISWALFFYDYPKSTDNSPKSILKLIDFFFTNVGSCVFNDLTLARIFGIILFFTFLVSFIYLIESKRLKEVIFPVMLSALGFLCSAVITYGRVNIDQANASRYLTFDLLIVIGQYLIFLHLKDEKHKFLIHCFTIFIALTLFGTVGSECSALKVCKQTRDNRLTGVQALMHYDTTPKRIKEKFLFPDERMLTVLKDFLQQNHLSIYKNS
jgi:hypothetical protein